MDRDEIFQGVKKCLMDCIRIDEDEIELDSKIIDDLGADSLDLLDIVFSLERHFKIKIRQGGIEKAARAGIAPEEFEVNGRLKSKGVERLRQILSEVPADKIYEDMPLSKLPYLFTVETFVKIVDRSVSETS